MPFQIQEARRTRAFLRIGLAGPSGSGKTLGALLIGEGLKESPDDKMILIDTENGSGDLYANSAKHGIGNYQTGRIQAPFTVEKYLEAIHACIIAGYKIIITDSLSHAWAGSGGLLEQKDDLAQGGRENSFTAWGKISPKHHRLVETILQAPAHIIATMRSKQEYAMEEENGKKVIKKLGMAPVQRDGMEYEFTVFFDIDIKSHFAVASKDRTDLFPTDRAFKISKQTGEELRNWYLEGTVAPNYCSRHKKVDQLVEVTAEDAEASLREFSTYLCASCLKAGREWKKPKDPQPPADGGGQDGGGQDGGDGPPPEAPAIDEKAAAEISEMAFGKQEAPVQAPAAGGNSSPMAVVERYKKEILAAKDLNALDGVYGLITLDKDVSGSKMVSKILQGLMEDRMAELAGVKKTEDAPKTPQDAPEVPEVTTDQEGAQPAPGEATARQAKPKKAASKGKGTKDGKCQACKGKGTVPKSSPKGGTIIAECADCLGAGVV